MLDRLAFPSRRLAAAAVLALVVAAPGLADKKKEAADDPLRAELEGKSPEQRVEHLTALIDAGKGTRDTYFHLGNARYETGDVKNAIDAFQQAVALDSTFFKAIVNLGLMFDEQQLYPKAIETFEQAARLQPDHPDVWSHMGNTYYAQNNHAKATELYRKALQLDPKAAHALYSMAVAFADAGIFREAVAYWRRVVEVDGQGELGKNAAENIELVQRYLIP